MHGAIFTGRINPDNSIAYKQVLCGEKFKYGEVDDTFGESDYRFVHAVLTESKKTIAVQIENDLSFWNVPARSKISLTTLMGKFRYSGGYLPGTSDVNFLDTSLYTVSVARNNNDTGVMLVKIVKKDGTVWDTNLANNTILQGEIKYSGKIIV